jgi:dipeptidyl aminopeptidase/acylaminoacyl peptidase
MTLQNLRHTTVLIVLLSAFLPALAQKPPITIDDHFNSVGFTALKFSPDGSALVIGTERADWDRQIFRKDLWLYRDDNKSSALVQLTQSGHDTTPRWSPDGRWIAFLSERKNSYGKDAASEDSSDSKDKDTAQIFLISANGGEAFPVTTGEEEVHSFSWSPDSRSLYFATRQPWTKEQKDKYKKDWKDVIQYRAAERGDTIFSLDVSDAINRLHAAATHEDSDAEKVSDTTPGSKPLAQSPWRIEQLEAAPDGRELAFVTTSISERQEKIEEFEIFALDVANASPAQSPRQLTHNEAIEQNIHWAPDSRHVFFQVDLGSADGKYKDTQTRLYRVDSQSSEVQRWAADFGGPITHYEIAGDGGVLASGRIGTEVQIYSQAKPQAPFTKYTGWAGTYENPAAAGRSPRVAFVYSSLERPTEVYIAESTEKLQQARPITSFNKLFTDRDLPRGKPYQWKADDGTTVEGMLMYPPGKFEAKNLPLFVFIHGGPADADGNHFEADWYQWDRLAATQGWLVFEPNYRGSSGYGDKFLAEIVPQLVSRPGKDILEGVDALVKDGIANPDRVAIGGYSYGGYMTNWLITQSTQWKAAVTGAGAVEHVGNWGNDDTTSDDAYFLGGRPWEAQQRYHDEAAIFQADKVRTPTHIVAGADDIRVAVLEDYLLDHALHALNIPSTLLIFPGEGHSLSKNPWHGKIKVREELKWLQKYGGVGTDPQTGLN